MTVTQPIFGFIVLVSFICMLGGMFLLPLPQDTPTLQLMTTFLGILAGSFTTVVSYYFGSSKQSQNKDDAISSLATTASTAATTASTTANTAAAVVAANGTGNGNSKPGA